MKAGVRVGSSWEVVTLFMETEQGTVMKTGAYWDCIKFEQLRTAELVHSCIYTYQTQLCCLKKIKSTQSPACKCL